MRRGAGPCRWPVICEGLWWMESLPTGGWQMQQSYWQQNGKARDGAPKFGKLAENMSVDVVVVGGGITGITAAYLIKKAGLKVALLERWRCLDGDSGRTTAHLTCVMDWRLGELVDNVGAESARGAWEAGATAINQIEEIVKKEK